MKKYLVLALLFAACQQQQKPTTPNATPDVTVAEKPTAEISNSKEYSNERFRHVVITKITTDQYRVAGQAQLFEAALSWVVEDGHNELTKGFEMTDAGAPEFGNFNFIVTVQKAQPNSTLHLILFESSAKDGSRQHELAIPLE